MTITEIKKGIDCCSQRDKCCECPYDDIKHCNNVRLEDLEKNLILLDKAFDIACEMASRSCGECVIIDFCKDKNMLCHEVWREFLLKEAEKELK